MILIVLRILVILNKRNSLINETLPPGSRTALLLNCSISSLQVGLVAQGAYNQITKFRNSHGKFKVKVHNTSIHMEQTETSVNKCPGQHQNNM